MAIKLHLYFIVFIELVRAALKKFFLKILGISIRTGRKLRISKGTSILVYSSKAILSFGNNNYIRSNCSIILSEGNLSIGHNFFMNNYSSINCLGKISIGNDCLLGEGVRLYDHNYDYHSAHGATINKKGHKKGYIEIGNNCWIGSGCIILMNVKIGNNVIIGAGNIVHQDVQDNTIIMARQEHLIKPYLI